MSKLRVSVVPYLNARPFVFGIEHSDLADQVELIFQPPSVGAHALQNGDVDIALAPVALIPQLSRYFILSNFGIACDGEVGSVGVCCNSPLEDLEAIQLDVHSLTSNALLSVLLKEHWKLKPRLSAGGSLQPELGQREGALLIGTRAMDNKGGFNHFYDLGQAWKELTGQPFVFAVWLSLKEFPDEFMTSFESALRFGVDQIKRLELEEPQRYYLSHQIRYDLDAQAMSGLDTFLTKLKGIEMSFNATGSH